MTRVVCSQCGNLLEGLNPYCLHCGTRIVCIFCGSKQVSKAITTSRFAVPVCGCCREKLERYFIFFCLKCGMIAVGRWENLKEEDPALYEYLRPFKTEGEWSKTFGLFSFTRCYSCVGVSPTEELPTGSFKNRLN